MSKAESKDIHEIVHLPETSLAVPDVPLEGILSIHTVTKLLQFDSPHYPHHMDKNFKRLKKVLGEEKLPQQILDYFNEIQQIKPAKRFPKEPKLSVIPWSEEIVNEGQSMVDEFLDRREKHPLIIAIKSLKDSALLAKKSLSRSISDTRRYLKFFFPRLPLDETENISFDAIIPTTKKVLWGAYENSGVPFRTHGKVERSLEKEELIIAGPLLPETHYVELAQILGTDITTFAANLHRITQQSKIIKGQLLVDEETEPIFNNRHFVSAVNIVNHTTREILSQPNRPESGLLGMHLWQSLKEIKNTINPLIGENVSADDYTYPYQSRKGGLLPQINYLLKPPYRLFIHVLENQGFRWQEDWRGKRKDFLIKNLN